METTNVRKYFIIVYDNWNSHIATYLVCHSRSKFGCGKHMSRWSLYPPNLQSGDRNDLHTKKIKNHMVQIGDIIGLLGILGNQIF